MILRIFFLLYFISMCYSQQSNIGDDQMRQRIQNIKRACVRIFVNDKPVGSGFVVQSRGLIATCFHVVQSIQPTANNQTSITYAQNIEVELHSGNKLPATIHSSCLSSGVAQALSKDYCLLQINTQNLSTVLLGTFADIQEGDRIYLCGYPLGIDQPVIANGFLSTKWSAQGYLGQGSTRAVAWLDITMNGGNSGGPIVLLSDDPANDKIIGIATFGLNPFAKPAKELIEVAQSSPFRMLISGVNFKEFATLVGSALASNSLGVNGCVSIDYLNTIIP